jgi:hypothetical protein
LGAAASSSEVHADSDSPRHVATARVRVGRCTVSKYSAEAQYAQTERQVTSRLQRTLVE